MDVSLFADELVKAIPAALLAAIGNIVLLVLTWRFGLRILNQWEARKKRKDVDITTSTDFQLLYAEAKAISRTWRFLAKANEGVETIPKDERWELLTRAINAESKVEALVVKLATERDLGDEDIRTLGLLRQAFQQIRDDIHDGQEHLFIGTGTGYTLFNALASDVALIVSNGAHCETLSQTQARRNLHEIARYGSHYLLEEAQKPEYLGADHPVAELRKAGRTPAAARSRESRRS